MLKLLLSPRQAALATDPPARTSAPRCRLRHGSVSDALAKGDALKKSGAQRNTQVGDLYKVGCRNTDWASLHVTQVSLV